MGDTKKNLKDTFDTVKSGTKVLKNVTKSATLVRKGIGTGIKILDEMAPDAGQKVHDVMDSVQRKLEDHEGDIENVVSKIQSGFDRVVGDRIEAVVEKLENKIDEKGGRKIEAKFEETVEKVETFVSPIIQKGKKIATDGSKDIIKKVIEKNLK